MKILDKKDTLCFVASKLWMDTRKLPRISEYFCTDDDLKDKFMCRLRDNSGFGRNQLMNYYKTLRLFDKKEAERQGLSDRKNENYDALHWCRPVLNCFNKAIQSIFNPGRELSLDESMDLFTVSILK